MNIFISSVTSYLGKAIALTLLKSSHHVTGTYRTLSNLSPELLSNTRFTPLKVNLNLEEKIPLLDSSFDVFILATGAYRTNVNSIQDQVFSPLGAAKFIYNQARLQSKQSLVIHLSTLSVYGSKVRATLTSKTTPTPDTLYGLSKQLTEEFLRAGLSAEHTLYQIRLPVVLGAFAHRAWLPTLLAKIKNRETISLYNIDSLYNSCVSVSSLLRYILYLISTEQEPGDNTFPVGSSKDITVKELFARIANQYNYSRIPDIIDCTDEYSIDIQTAESLGYPIETTSRVLQYWLSSDLAQKDYM